MIKSFEERERGFEAKFAYDEDHRFRLTARRDKLFAAWLSAKCRLSAPDAQSLQDAILIAAGGAGHDGAVFVVATTNLALHSTSVTQGIMDAALAACATQAAEQLARESIP